MGDEPREFTPLRCAGCGTTAFDPEPGGEHRDERVMSLQRFWIMDSRRSGPGPAYAVCNACHDREFGALWADDGTLARFWYVGDDDSV